jgi:hypothetical protein
MENRNDLVAALLRIALMMGIASAQTSTTNTTDRANRNAVMHVVDRPC